MASVRRRTRMPGGRHGAGPTIAALPDLLMDPGVWAASADFDRSALQVELGLRMTDAEMDEVHSTGPVPRRWG